MGSKGFAKVGWAEEFRQRKMEKGATSQIKPEKNLDILKYRWYTKIILKEYQKYRSPETSGVMDQRNRSRR